MNHEYQVFNFQLSFAKIEKGRDIKADKKKIKKRREIENIKETRLTELPVRMFGMWTKQVVDLNATRSNKTCMEQESINTYTKRVLMTRYELLNTLF